MFKNSLIICLIIFSITGLLNSCSEDEVCDFNCDSRFDACYSDCNKNNPSGSQQLIDCRKNCDTVYEKCIGRCNGTSF